MGLFDFLTGDADPDPAVPRLPPGDLRARLLGLRGADGGWHVRTAPHEGADLVVEWGPVDLDFRGVYGVSGWRSAKRMLLRMVDADGVVRSVDEDGVFTWMADADDMRFEGRRTRGQSWSAGGQLTFGNVDGTPDHVAALGFDTGAMKRAVRDAVVDAGWRWRGVAFGRL